LTLHRVLIGCCNKVLVHWDSPQLDLLCANDASNWPGALVTL